MIETGRDLTEEGLMLEVPPRSAAERQAFGCWLVAALARCALEPPMLAAETGVPECDIEAMLYELSHGTAKADRVEVYEAVLDRLAKAKGMPERTFGADARSTVRDVLAGRIDVAAFFSPSDDLQSAITSVIASAEKELCIQAWQLTCPRILDALINSRVAINIAVSHGNRVCSKLGELMQWSRVNVYWDPQRKNHNKTIVADRRIVLTGSVNFSFRSGLHDENLLVTSRPELADAYWNDFEKKRSRFLRITV